MEDIDPRRARRRIAEAQRNMDRQIAALLSGPAVENPFHNPVDWLPPSSIFRSPVFQMRDGKLTEIGVGPVEYMNPARRIIERVRAEASARASVVEPKLPIAVCATLYKLAADVEGVPRGAVVCGRCEEVWDIEALRAACEHEAKGLCVAVAVKYRSTPAQAFYAWCKANGFIARHGT